MPRLPKEYEFRVVGTAPAERAGIVRTSPTSAVAGHFYAWCEVAKPIRLDVGLDVIHNGIAARVVEVRVAPGDGLRGSLNTTALRSVLIDQLLQAALAKEADRVGPPLPPPPGTEDSLRSRAFRVAGDPPDEFTVAPVPDADGRRRRTPDELAVEAAQHYSSAQAAGDPAPAMAVVRAMHVSRSTVARYLHRARELELLPDHQHGRRRST